PAGIDAQRDVAGLGVQVALDLAGVGGEADLGVGVADLAHGAADEVLDGGLTQVGLGGDLAGDDGEGGGGERLAGDAAGGVGGEAVVQDGVGNLVGHLVGMALRHGFGSEKVSVRAHDIMALASEGKTSWPPRGGWWTVSVSL